MIRTGVSGRVFLLVPAYPGCPGPKAVKRLCVCVCVCVVTRRVTGHARQHHETDWLQFANCGSP